MIDQRRLFAAAVAASVALHVMALALLPATGRVRRDDVPSAMEVRLRPTVIVRADEAEPAVAPTPVRAARADARRAPPVPKPAPAAPAPERHAAHASQLPELALDGRSSPISEPSVETATAETGVQSTSTEPPQSAPPAHEAGTAAGAADRASVAYLHAPPPRYPAFARRNGESGNVALKVLVGADGGARSVEIETSSGSRALDLAARDAVQGWRFVPARRGTSAVDAWVIVQFAFRLDGRE